MTAGGYRLNLPCDASSPAVSMTNAKLHINSTISDAHKGARYLGIDITNFYLVTNMPYHQYMHIHPSKIPQEIKNEYGFFISANGHVYLEICEGMYGIKEASVLAFNQLFKSLAPHVYKPMLHSTGMWRHCTLKTTFDLCVNDFGNKYFSKIDAGHLINALQQNYKITTNWTGSLYCGLKLH